MDFILTLPLFGMNQDDKFMNKFALIDYGIVGVYLISMILIGFLTSRLSKDDKDFFKGGSKIPWGMASLSLFISGFSAYMFVAASGQAYKNGISCLVLFTSNVYGFIIVTFFLIHRWRRTRITSPMEYIQMRYGNPTRIFLTILQIPLSLLALGNMLYVLCIFISSALGLTGQYHILGFTLTGLQLSIVVTGCIVVSYTTMGGIWAVVITDTVQFIIVMVITIVIIPLSLNALSQGGGLIETIRAYIQNPPKPDYFHLVKPTQPLSFSLAWMALTSFGVLGGFDMVQRANCVADERAAKKVTGLATFLFLIAPVLWVAPVIIMRPLLPDMREVWPQLKNPDEGTFVAISLMLLPNGMLGLIVSAILAASMSTISTVFNIMSAIFTRDLYRPLIAPQAHPDQLMRVGRIATLVFGVIAIGLGFVLSRLQDAFTTTFTIYSHISIAFAFPMIMGILIRRIPWWTAIASITVCFTTTLSLEMFSPRLCATYGGIFAHVSSHLFQYKIFAAIIMSGLTFFIASRFYREDGFNEDEATSLFRLIKKPIRDDETDGVFIPNLKTYRIVGGALALLGVSLVGLYILPSVKDPKGINLITGIIFLTIFGVIQWLTSPRYSPSRLVRQQLMDSEK